MEHPLTIYRTLAGQTMEAFAASIGVSKASVSKWEAGLAMPRRLQLDKISSVTNGCVAPVDFWQFYYFWGR